MTAVPCNGCRLCCINEAVVLMPGDDAKSYDTEPFGDHLRIRTKASGECVYLGETGCTIHDRAPQICKVYDCRQQYRMMRRQDRRKAVAQGLMTKDKLDAGRKRLHTL